jgi:CO/xanthine dehydrogenase FAD-binding subunit
MSLGAKVRLLSEGDEGLISLQDLYRNDGKHYLQKRPTEILTEIELDPTPDWRSTYWKLRRRGAFDFPVLSVAAALQTDRNAVVSQARIVLGAVDSQPLFCTETAAFLSGQRLTDEVISEAGRIAARQARAVNNTDHEPLWRKNMSSVFMTYALRELRGADVSELRRRVAHQSRN